MERKRKMERKKMERMERKMERKKEEKGDLNIPKVVALLGLGVVVVSFVVDFVATILSLLGVGVVFLALLWRKKDKEGLI